jgi:hypothetical protein
MVLPNEGDLGENFDYDTSGNIRIFTLNTDFITNNWVRLDVTHSSNTSQLIIDGNNKKITINQEDFDGLFFAGNEYSGNDKPTILKNFNIVSNINILSTLARATGHLKVQNCTIDIYGDINNNGGGMIFNNDTSSNTKIILENCMVRVFGRIGENSGSLIGYIQLNSGSIYNITNCGAIVSDNDSLNGFTLKSGSGAFIGSGISNTVNIEDSFCIFNGSMTYGSGVISGKFLGSDDNLTINKFYAVTNITYINPNFNPSDISQYSYNMSSYHGGSGPNIINITNLNILHLNNSLEYIYGLSGTLYPTVTNFNKHTTYNDFQINANSNDAKIGNNSYILRNNLIDYTLYIYDTDFKIDYDLTENILKGIAKIESGKLSERIYSNIPFTPDLPIITIGNGNISYSSSDSSIASINNITGEIRMYKLGNVIISYIISDTDQYIGKTILNEFIIKINITKSAIYYILFINKIRRLIQNKYKIN